MVKRQLPLFANEPDNPKDITRKTPFGATFELFRQHLAQEGKSEHTIKAFLADLNLLGEFSDLQTPITNYTTTNLNEFLHWMEYGRGVACSRKTYARRVTSLKVFFKWLKTVGALTHDPAQAVLQRSGPAPLSQVLTPDDEKSAILAAQGMKKGDEHDHRPEFLFLLLLETGIKKSEAGRLTLKDFDRSNPEQPLVFIRHKTKNVYKERRIAITPHLYSAYEEYKAQYLPKDTIFTCTTRNLEYILTDIGERADIPFKLSFEVMRWTSATRDYRAGLEEDTIREKMGLSHTSWYETSAKIKQLSAQINEQQAR